MRRNPLLLGSLTALLLVSLPLLAKTGHASPQAKETDAWAGSYLKYAKYDTHREGQFGEAQEIKIIKDGEGYRLSKPYEGTKFTEVEKGVLSDGGHLGKIYLGSYQFSDGKQGHLLRANFCYETFVLWSEQTDAPEQQAEKRP